jgi:hypothetical protein
MHKNKKGCPHYLFADFENINIANKKKKKLMTK